MKISLKLLLRHFRKDSAFYIINIGGLCLGVLTIIMISMWLVSEFNYDKFHNNSESIYRIVCENSATNQKSAFTPNAIPKSLKDRFSIIDDATYIQPHGKKCYITYNEHTFTAKNQFVGKRFFDIFSFQVLEGNPKEIDEENRKVVITSSLAKKLFGNQSAIGKVIKRGYPVNGTFKVCAVIDDVKNTHLDLEFITLDHPHPANKWTHNEVMSYVVHKGDPKTLHEHQQIAQHLDDKLDLGDFLEFQPITDIHLYTNFSDPAVKNHGNLGFISILAIIMIVIIILTVFNFINLSVAKSETKFKELALKKIFGVQKKEVLYQILFESIIQILIAVVISVFIVIILGDRYQEFIGIHSSFLDFGLNFYLLIAVALLLMVLPSSLYLGNYLYKFNPIKIFSGGNTKRNKSEIRRIVFYLQMFISLSLLISAYTFNAQLQYMRNKNLGLDLDNIIQIKAGEMMYQFDNLRPELLKNPNIISVSAAYSPPEDLSYKITNVKLNGESIDIKSPFFGFFCSQDFNTTFGLSMVKGTFLTEINSFKRHFNITSRKKSNDEIVLNEAAIKLLKLKDPIGKTISANNHIHGKVIGVVKDFHFKPINENIAPLLIYYSAEEFWTFFVRLKKGNEKETINYIETKSKQFTKNEPFTYSYVKEAFTNRYKSEASLSYMTNIFTMLAVIIALIGFIGILTFDLSRRTKEIGIRKILGGGTRSIIILFLKEISITLGIVFVPTSFILYFLMDIWLASYAYSITFQVLFPIFALATLLIPIFIIVSVVVSVKTKVNPIDTIRIDN
ncbi:MAG: ABC transporter permease [Hyphomicrobiales bacterium]